MAFYWKTMPRENRLKEFRVFSLLNKFCWYGYRQNKDNGI